MSSVVCVVYIVVGVVLLFSSLVLCLLFLLFEFVVRLFLGLFVVLYVCLLLFGCWLMDLLCGLLFV